MGNQSPTQHLPSQMVMLSAIAAVTSRIRLMATPPLIAAGVASITIKPSQFIDIPSPMPDFLREVDRRVEALA